MMNEKFSLVRIAFITVLVITINAGSFLWGNTIAGDFMDNPINVRSLALGNCSAALVDHSAFYSNPATTILNDSSFFSISQGSVFSDVNYMNMNYSNPKIDFWDLGVGASFLSSSVEGIPEATYDRDNQIGELTGETFGYTGQALILSASKAINNSFTVGSNLKIISESLYEETSSGFGLDLGMSYKINESIMLGSTFYNFIKPTITWSTGESYDLNSKIITGISWKINDQFTLMGDIEKIGNRNLNNNIGLEITPIQNFAFRTGFGNQRFTLGTGLEFSNMKFDYAYVDNKSAELGTTQYFSVAILLGSDNEITELERAEALARELAEAVNRARLSETVTGGYTEIEPLPLPEEEAIPLEQLAVSENIENPVTQNFDEVTPIIKEAVEEELVTVSIQEDFTEAVLDYSIVMISPIYYDTSNHFQAKAYLDNIGNRTIAVSANFKILAENHSAHTSFKEQSINITTEQSGVFYFDKDFTENHLPVGVYYLELTTLQGGDEKYLKEKYIKR